MHSDARYRDARTENLPADVTRLFAEGTDGGLRFGDILRSLRSELTAGSLRSELTAGLQPSCDMLFAWTACVCECGHGVAELDGPKPRAR